MATSLPSIGNQRPHWPQQPDPTSPCDARTAAANHREAAIHCSNYPALCFVVFCSIRRTGPSNKKNATWTQPVKQRWEPPRYSPKEETIKTHTHTHTQEIERERNEKEKNGARRELRQGRGRAINTGEASSVGEKRNEPSAQLFARPPITQFSPISR